MQEVKDNRSGWTTMAKKFIMFHHQFTGNHLEDQSMKWHPFIKPRYKI